MKTQEEVAGSVGTNLPAHIYSMFTSSLQDVSTAKQHFSVFRLRHREAVVDAGCQRNIDESTGSTLARSFYAPFDVENKNL
jgi:hypothetical protein